MKKNVQKLMKLESGFTLVELLVVISIIAVLLAVLIPAMNKAREQARTIVCETNLKNYGIALPMYAQDNSDKTPFMETWLYSRKTIDSGTGKNGNCPKLCRWHYDKDQPDGSLWPYLKNKNVHLCATFRNYAINSKCSNSSKHTANTPFNPMYSYAMNYHLGFDWKTYLSSSEGSKRVYSLELTMKLSQVNRSSKCFAFSEENPWSVVSRREDGSRIYSYNVLNDNALWLNANSDLAKVDDATDNFATYHNVSQSNKNEGKGNAVFVDGHVSTLKGLAGYNAYFEYGRPYAGHEKLLNSSVHLW